MRLDLVLLDRCQLCRLVAQSEVAGDAIAVRALEQAFTTFKALLLASLSQKSTEQFPTKYAFLPIPLGYIH